MPVNDHAARNKEAGGENEDESVHNSNWWTGTDPAIHPTPEAEPPSWAHQVESTKFWDDLAKRNALATKAEQWKTLQARRFTREDCFMDKVLESGQRKASEESTSSEESKRTKHAQSRFYKQVCIRAVGSTPSQTLNTKRNSERGDRKAKAIKTLSYQQMCVHQCTQRPIHAHSNSQ
jgi:hypothetical protein